jgi:putrescine transport system ATP-binding protein
VAAEVIDLAYLGSHTVYHLKMGSGRKLEVSAPNSARLQANAPTWGDRVHATWPETAMVLLTR